MNNIGKQYPRIFSFSTIGLIQHFNVDYLFHPFRTDFSGESGVGKTSIANLLQLIFIGNKHFKPASNSTYNPSGYVLNSRNGKKQSFGYAFINIEMEKGKYLVVGIFIKSTTNYVDHFIIQGDADWDNPTYLNRPLLHTDLLDNEEIISLEELLDFIKHKFYCEKFEIRRFQEKLLNYSILPFNLHEDENNTLKYAKILKSFSAGKEFQWKESESLKKFLFGESTYKRIREEYEEGIIQIEKKYSNSDRNDKDIEIAVTKGKQVLELAKLKNEENKARIENSIANNVYWHFRKKELEKNLKVLNEKKLKTNIELTLLDFEQKDAQLKSLEEELNTILKKQEELNNTSEEINTLSKIDFAKTKRLAEEKWNKTLAPFLNVQKIEECLKELNTIETLKAKYENHLKLIGIKELLTFLKDKNTSEISWTDEFEESAWSRNFNNAEANYPDEIKALDDRIKHFDNLMAFSNYSNENSIIKWAIDNKDIKYKFNEIQESVIAHYYDKLLTKPDEQPGEKYIPSPDELIEQTKKVQIDNQNKKGFWLNLGGIHEYIKFRDTYFLNIEKSTLINEINTFSEKIEAEKKKIVTQKERLILLRKILNEFTKREVFLYYWDREEIMKKGNYECLNEINSSTDLNQKLKDYSKKDQIIKDYNEAEEEKTEINEQEKKLTNLKTKKEELIEYLKEHKEDDKKDLIKSKKEKANKLNAELVKYQDIENYHKIKLDLDKEVNDNAKQFIDTLEIWKRKNIEKQSTETLIQNIQKELENAKEKLEKAKTECKLNDIKIDLNDLRDTYTNLPENIQGKELSDKEGKFEEHYNFLVKTYFGDDSILKEMLNYGILVQKLLPQIFKNLKFEESKVIDEVEKYLKKISSLSKEINSVFVQLLSERFQEVISAYNEYDRKHKRLKQFFSKEGTRITGGYNVKLTFEKSEKFPIAFLDDVKSELNNEMSYTKGMFLEHLPKRKDIETKILEIYKRHAKVYTPPVIELLNPLNYFGMDFSMESARGKRNKGSTGQNYAAIALLCIAQMSEIYKDTRNKTPDGIRIMPLDDAQDLGSNYEMLYNIAKEEDYQIITMSISPLDNLELKNQNWYMLNDNPEEPEINYPPFAVLSGEEETIYDWEKYLNRIADEKPDMD